MSQEQSQIYQRKSGKKARSSKRRLPGIGNTGSEWTGGQTTLEESTQANSRARTRLQTQNRRRFKSTLSNYHQAPQAQHDLFNQTMVIPGSIHDGYPGSQDSQGLGETQVLEKALGYRGPHQRPQTSHIKSRRIKKLVNV